ncbi:hypothetical protein BJI69_21325 [Luteibacter rhizovicinus DSM 16549]|uniref:Uncharacterized protein n=2 Tax=Luteibacter rhizovicinus TaxID=242606 RepID=A0A1L3EYS2_9GAMM|nr:hypothetical protein BJI69_21325 [Luteibacter rhizovicinus DSM 16549]KLD77451.1 hypothetical protein Y886_15630 [Xanthomonas hyacinthi DSM 19077]
MLIVCLMFVTTTGFAQAPEGVTRRSPLSSFSTHKTSDDFARCMSEALRTDFPASRVDPGKAGKEILVSGDPSAAPVAVIDVADGVGGGAMVVIRTASSMQPARDPTVKIARNCQ